MYIDPKSYKLELLIKLVIQHGIKTRLILMRLLICDIMEESLISYTIFIVFILTFDYIFVFFSWSLFL